MLKTIIITILLIGYSSFANAQQSRVFSTKIFKPNLYIGANTGLNLFVGEDYDDYLLADPLSFLSYIDLNGRAAVGYNFTPVIGMRSFIGYFNHKWYDIDNDSVKLFGAKYIMLDLIYNISNRIATYDLNRPFDLSIFVGGGITQSNIAGFIPIVHGGLQADYRLSPFVDFNLIGDINIVTDKYNGLIRNRKIDLYPSLSVGITYHFRKKRHCNCE